jgi:hypothetical protein
MDDFLQSFDSGLDLIKSMARIDAILRKKESCAFSES